MRKFGAKIFYGDASRPEILDAAQTGKARAFVLAIDNVEASLRTAQMVRQHYPHVPIYARARATAGTPTADGCRRRPSGARPSCPRSS